MSPTIKNFAFVLVILAVGGDSHPLVTNLIDEQQSDVIDLSRLGVMLFNEPDESVGKIVSDWTPDNDQNPEELGSYLEGDMLIPGVEGRNGLVKQSSRWQNGIVPYVFSGLSKYYKKTFGNSFNQGFNSTGDSDRRIIMKAIDEYHSKTCIKFVPRSNEKDFLSFESTNTGCWSSVGRIGKRQAINLQSPGCTTKIGTPMHEIMHALGFLHEQNRNDRDSFVRVITSNIKPETLTNFEKASASETTDYGVRYDTGSQWKNY